MAGSSDRPGLRIATDAAFPPFHFVTDGGRPDGFEIRLARLVADAAGFDAEVLLKPYDELLPGLDENGHDVVAATTGITAERQQRFLFSRPYFSTCQVAVVRSGVAEPQDLSDLDGLRLGAAGSGTSRRAMRSVDAVHVSIGDGEGLQLLASGTIDAWIVDEYEGVTAVRTRGERLRLLADGLVAERYAFVLAQGRKDLKKALDDALDTLLENGSVDELGRQFGLHRDADWPVSCPE